LSYAERFTQTHKTNFKDAARMAVDYQDSKLRATVTEMPCEGERSAEFLYYDSVKAQRREGRVPVIRDNPANRRRRWLKYQPTFDSGEFIDSNDKFQGMTNFQSPLMTAHSGAVRRFIDEDVILEGIHGDAWEGELGATTIAFPDANVIGVTVQAGSGSGAVGMNLEKIKTSRKRFAAAKFDLNVEEPFLLLTAEQIDDLSNEIELTNADYRAEAGPAFSRDGKLSKVWNHWIIEFQSLREKQVSTNIVQRNVAYMKSCLMLGVWQDVDWDAYPIPDRDNELYMIAKANMDCRRADEKGVYEIESFLRAA
jgi:hypothetical protein